MPSNDNPDGPFAVIRGVTYRTPTLGETMHVSIFPSPELWATIHRVAATLPVDLRPRLRGYANGYSVAFRNEQGDRVCVMIGLQSTPAQIEQALRSAWGWKLNELASPETVARLYDQSGD